MTLHPLEMLSVGCAIGGPIITAYAEWESSAETTLLVPPIRTYVAGEHIEVDITIRRLPPP